VDYTVETVPLCGWSSNLLLIGRITRYAKD
jgi:hypothetical protein